MELFKKRLYFLGARYFAFFAKIKLARWKPRIILITGSSGKTTLLHLIKSQLKDKAIYSEHANSSYGIPFHILGLSRPDLTVTEWISLLIKAPFQTFSPVPTQNIYVVEADCDRPYEGDFLSKLITPGVSMWLSSGRTHSMNFDDLVAQKKFSSVEEAIAHEFGYFIERTKSLVVVNGDSSLIDHELTRTKAQIVKIEKKDLKKYSVSPNHTEFTINDKLYTIPASVPESVYYAVAATRTLMDYLKEDLDDSFATFSVPPGRSGVFAGIKKTTLVDSSYNANSDSMAEILNMYRHFPGSPKWAVISDMLEQGNEEQEEHENLAEEIAKIDLDRLILMGPRTTKHTYPAVKKLLNGKIPIAVFETPKEVLDFLKKTIGGGETILFKGGRFLEGVIEQLLADKKDTDKLCRREKIWHIRRKQWGL